MRCNICEFTLCQLVGIPKMMLENRVNITSLHPCFPVTCNIGEWIIANYYSNWLRTQATKNISNSPNQHQTAPSSSAMLVFPFHFLRPVLWPRDADDVKEPIGQWGRNSWGFKSRLEMELKKSSQHWYTWPGLFSVFFTKNHVDFLRGTGIWICLFWKL